MDIVALSFHSNVFKMESVKMFITFTSIIFICDLFGNASSVVVIESDIIVNLQLPLNATKYKDKTIVFRHRNKRAVNAIKERIWPNATIPYIMSKNITDTVRLNVMKAMSHWEKHTCIKFVKRADEENYLLIGPGDCGCCSFVGMEGGEQNLTLDAKCAVYGVILHEIGHAVGFWHEHSRPDRDEFIKILKYNVQPSKLSNFQVKNKTEVNSLGQPYDYDSIMHYGKKTFSIRNRNTVEPLALGVHIGQRTRLSEGDIIQANLLYNCPKQQCWNEFFETEGNFTSPNFPQVYYKNYECTWIIHAFPGEKIILSFPTVDLENSYNCSYDFVEIRQGLEKNNHLVGKLCGKGSIDRIESETSLTIQFHSDKSVARKGFYAHFIKSVTYELGSGEGGSGELNDDSNLGEYMFVQEMNNMEHNLSEVKHIADCNTLASSVRGEFVSPLVMFDYSGPPVHCTWTIDGGLNATRILLKVSEDSRELSASRSHCMGEITQAKPLNRSNENNQVLPGDFRVNVESLQPVKYNCSESLEVVINSHSAQIHWSSKKHPKFSSKDLQYIIDYDECSSGQHDCQHICVNTVEGFTCACHRGYILDGSGFYCKRKQAHFVDRCNSNLTKERGRIRAGTEPYTDCFFYIHPVQQPSRIVLSFQKFNVPSYQSENISCTGTYIEVIGGDKIPGEGERFCGKVPPYPQVYHKAITLRVHIDINTVQYLPYFTAEYYVYHDTRNDKAMENKNELHDESRCFKRLQTNDLLTSPSYPQLYAPYIMCTWRVSARHLNTLTLIMEQFDLEYTRNCAFDFLEIRDGKHRNAPLIGKFCGSRFPKMIKSSGRHLWIVFVTDGSGGGRGFKGRFISQRVEEIT